MPPSTMVADAPMRPSSMVLRAARHTSVFWNTAT